MKLLIWNIKQGGGPRRDRIAASIIAQDPDLVALIEFVPTTAAPLLSRLRDAGFKQQVSTNQNGFDYAICVMSKHPMTTRPSGIPLLDDSGLWLEIGLPSHGFSIGIVFVPTKSKQKRPYCDALVEIAASRQKDAFFFAGDFNTGRHPEDGDLKSLGGVNQFESILKAGFTDAWRHFHRDRQESTYVWRTTKQYRIDHALVSATLMPRVTDCHYSHDERVAGESDHSVLLVEIR